MHLSNIRICVRIRMHFDVVTCEIGRCVVEWLVSEYLGLVDLKIGTFRLRWKLTAKGELCEKKLSAEGTRDTKIAMATNLSGRYH